jgi:dethiobiotin synthetase
MSGVLVITGTDTDAGKTVVAAALTAVLQVHYWKPIQSGLEGGTDSSRVQALGVPKSRVLPEAYRLELPASPHLSAEREGLTLDLTRIALPATPRPLIVEGAGGLMVPIRRDPPWLMIDQFAAWNAPVLLVARTALGTINHSILSIEALRRRGVPIAGIVFSGPPHEDNERIVPALGAVRCFGRLPWLDPLDLDTLAQAACKHLDLDGLREALAS